MKKAAVILFILLFTLTFCFTSYAEGEKTVTEGEMTVKVDDTKYTLSGLSFTYDDAYFKSSPSEFSPDIARASIILSSLAHFPDQIKDCLSSMGYEVLGEYNYDREYTKEDCGYTAFVIARKKAVFSDGSTFWIYIVSVRGTNGLEWYSNFDIGTDTDHAGFTHAADDVMSAIGSAVDTPKEMNKILVTGHSRGAAVANLAAHSLIKSSELAESENVFGYTFACPTVTKSPSEGDAIFNINNPGDIVPLLPLPGWGYGRHGKDITFPTDAGTLASLDSIMRRYTGEPYTGNTDFSEFETLTLKWCPTSDDFYKSRPLSPSPADCINGLAELLISGDYSGAMKLVSPFLADTEARNALMYLFTNMTAIGAGHSPVTYICWLEAINQGTPANVIDVSSVKLAGGEIVYDGKTHDAPTLSDVPEHLTYTLGGDVSATDAGSYVLTVEWKSDDENYTPSVEKTELEWNIKKASYDMEDAKWDYKEPFKADGSEHTVSVTGLPDGVTAVYSGTYKATEAGTYTAGVEFEYDEKNYYSPALDDLEWTIEKAPFHVIPVVGAAAIVIAAAVAAAIIVKRKKSNHN